MRLPAKAGEGDPPAGYSGFAFIEIKSFPHPRLGVAQNG